MPHANIFPLGETVTGIQGGKGEEATVQILFLQTAVPCHNLPKCRETRIVSSSGFSHLARNCCLFILPISNNKYNRKCSIVSSITSLVSFIFEVGSIGHPVHIVLKGSGEHPPECSEGQFVALGLPHDCHLAGAFPGFLLLLQ